MVVASLLRAGMVTGSYAEEPKVLHMSQNAEMDTLDTGNTGLSATIDMMNLMMDCLFRLDENNVPQPNVCESYTVSEDGLTYTFTLRDSTWSNGTPVTAADFEYAWKRTCDPANDFENAFLFNYIPMKNLAEINAGTADISTLGVTAKDDKTLVVELTTPCNWLVEYLCACFFAPLNQEFVESCGDQYALSSDNLLTNGPFKLENWTAGDLTWTLTKNPDHPDADKIYFDAVEYQVIKDNQTAIMAFESGTVDFVTISSDQVALYEGSEAFLSAPSTTSCYIVPNFEDPTLQNQNLLYAIGFSIDRDSLTQNILADGSVAKYDCNYTDCFFGPDGTEFNSARPDFWACDKAKALPGYDSLLVLTHFKGHTKGGFGGSCKNIGIGCADGRVGKAMIHTTPGSDDMWDISNEEFMERMTESAKAVADHFGKHIVYINVLRNMSVSCDCEGCAAEPVVTPNVGILASTDLLAVDQASVDLIYAMQEHQHADLVERMESRHGLRQLSYMKELGMGNDRYRLLDIENDDSRIWPAAAVRNVVPFQP